MYELLKGIRVIDLTTIVLGPYATQLLGDFGADVIKIENLSGDLFRTVRPGRSPGMGAGFINCNRNKRSVAIDLKTPEGKSLLYELVAGADVVVHNMRNKSALKLGVSYEQIKAVNDRIVYCSAPGYGQAGLRAEEPAYDDIIQAASGVAWLNAGADGQPRFIPTIICDKVGGLQLALAVLGGIVHRLQSGLGCAIEAPMFESMVSFLMAEQLAGQSFVPELGSMGYERLLSPHRRPFPTRDGYIGILPYTTRHWVAFLTLIGQQSVAASDLVTDPVKRSQNIDELYRLIAEATPSRTTAQWCVALNAEDIPCTAVNRIEDLLRDEHLKQVNFFTEYNHPSEGRLRGVRTPFTVTGVRQSADRPAPVLGESTLAVLRNRGIDEQKVEALIERGIVKPA